jgi:hypothetical protein
MCFLLPAARPCSGLMAVWRQSPPVWCQRSSHKTAQMAVVVSALLLLSLQECRAAGGVTHLTLLYWFHYREVERLAGLRRIRLRTGAFCNPGATAAALGLSSEDVRSHYEDAGHVCWDARDLIGADFV